MDAGVVPPDPGRVGVVAGIGHVAVRPAQRPPRPVGREAGTARCSTTGRCRRRRQRPMWWDAATTPGRIPSVRHASITKWPIRVVMRTRPFSSMPSASASDGWIHNGCRWLISFSHLLFAERVWTKVGMRNVGSRIRSSPARSRSSQWTCDGIHPGVACSGQPQSRNVVEYSSSFFDGVGKPTLASPSTSTAGEPSPRPSSVVVASAVGAVVPRAGGAGPAIHAGRRQAHSLRRPIPRRSARTAGTCRPVRRTHRGRA